MSILLNEVLHLTEEEISNSKIELNMTVGKKGGPFIDQWLNHSESEKLSGLTDCSYWGWYQGKRNFYPGQYVFSFCKLDQDEWLFISAGKVTDIPANGRATVEIIEKYKPFFGRLITKYHKGNTYSRYVFKLSKIINQITVKQILPGIYEGEDFRGYDNVNIPFRLLKNIFDGKIMPTYYNALKKITGIYCLTDTKTGKLYIGSASGNGGVAQRWGNYLDSSHGNNKKLIELYNDKGADYFADNFYFTLIEYFGLSCDPNTIIQREEYWKKCLQTVKFGYNS